MSPDGSKDENVFDIQQGVAIMLAVKIKSTQKNLSKIFYSDLWGKRENKFAKLSNSSVKDIQWITPNPRTPSLLFVPETSKWLEEYNSGFSISELFRVKSTGIVTMGDAFIIDENRITLQKRIETLLTENFSESSLKNQFGLGKNYAKWVVENKKNIVNDEANIIPLAYRPFDNRFTYFDNKLVWRPRTKVMQHYLNGDNLGLLFSRMTKGKRFTHIFATKNISETIYLSPLTGTNAFNAPLYLYITDNRVPNLKQEIVDGIEKIVGKTTPENIFDYIYAVLHSPSYREKYKEFLKIDFPRVPYPEDKQSFKKLVAFGGQLRSLHLLESPKVNQFITTYPVDGSNTVEKVFYEDGKVFINQDQYFGNVPESVWNFYIGGYQPARKWLKDRKGRELTNEDIEHYQKIIVSLIETERIMGKIDLITK